MPPNRTAAVAARSERILRTRKTDTATQTLKKSTLLEASSKTTTRKSTRTSLKEAEPTEPDTPITHNNPDGDYPSSHHTPSRAGTPSPPTTQKTAFTSRESTVFNYATEAEGPDDVEMSDGDSDAEGSSVINSGIQIPAADILLEDVEPVSHVGQRRKRAAKDTGKKALTSKRRKGQDGAIVVETPVRAKARATPKTTRNTVYRSDRTAKLLGSGLSVIAPAKEASSSHIPIILDDEVPTVPTTVVPEKTFSSAPRVSHSDFTLKKVLGTGGFGTVNIVTHNASNTDWAMKTIKKSHVEQTNCVQETMDEQAILNRLTTERFSYVPTLHSSFSDEENLYIVMSLCGGGTLSDKIHRRGALDANGKKLFLAQVVHAIDEIHRKGIVHQDLKPENILLTDGNFVRIVDFGLAQDFDRTDMQLDGITTGSGTFEYMAPEVLAFRNAQLKGSPDECVSYDYKCDIWSIGVIIYETTYLKFPFTKQSQLLAANYSRDGMGGKDNEHADDLISKLLKLEPSERLNAEEIKAHPYFEGIDWEKIAAQDFDAPTICRGGSLKKPLPVPPVDVPVTEAKPDWAPLDAAFYCNNMDIIPAPAPAPASGATVSAAGKGTAKTVKKKAHKVVKVVAAAAVKGVKKVGAKAEQALKKVVSKATKAGSVEVAKGATSKRRAKNGLIERRRRRTKNWMGGVFARWGSMPSNVRPALLGIERLRRAVLAITVWAFMYLILVPSLFVVVAVRVAILSCEPIHFQGPTDDGREENRDWRSDERHRHPVEPLCCLIRCHYVHFCCSGRTRARERNHTFYIRLGD